uniref:DNA polymerase n=1 Tax=uncultured marine group II/III euryarchaeote KM3_88_H06 TaxID=1456537 RepID=A0A075I033_9EURY|nr:DNA-directed DNA polymerase (DPA, polB1) [uncultured marine group II/III euryarchaeote KM3_88_H06]
MAPTTTVESCVVQGSYIMDSASRSDTVIELWCRAREGHSVMLLVTGMHPFLEISLPGRPHTPEDIEARLATVKSVKGVTGLHEPVDKWTDLGIKPHWKVEIKRPWMMTGGPKIRDNLERDWTLSSADIPFVNRLFLDNDIGPHITTEVEVLWAGDKAPEELLTDLPESHKGEESRREAADRIREAGGSGLYPVDLIATCHFEKVSRCEPFPTPFVLMSFDLETSIAEETILCAAAVIERGPDERTDHTFTGSEREIMAGLTALVREEDPDIITGYNIDNFDLPRINTRMADLTGRSDKAGAADAFGWGRVPLLDTEHKRLIPQRDGNRRTWRIQGRCVLDAWWQARMVLRPKRETLKFVCQLLWPEREDLQKMDVDASQMDREWAERPDVVLEYCLQDSLLPLEILSQIRAVHSKEALATVCGMPLDIAVAGTTSQWLDGLVIRIADRQNIAVPRTNRGGGRDQIAGGYVHEVEAGVHPWVAVLDFKSMYPSIMITNNICYTTRIDESARPDEVVEEGIHEAPDGARYLPATYRRGIVPRLLEDLMDLRDRHKEELREAIEKKDPTGEIFHGRMQYAVKILMNSFYGVFASKFYRFTHPELGASITAWARSNIKSIIAQLEEEGHPVVYSDTDSVFVRAPVDEAVPGKEPEEGEARGAWEGACTTMVEFGEELAERYSREGAELEFETGLSVFFSHGAKKRYIGRVVWPEPELLVRGYEVRRSDSFTILTDTMMEIFEMILDGDSNDAVQHCLQLIKRLRAREVAPRDLVISRSCKGRVRPGGVIDFDAVYANPDSLPFVRAAKQRIEAGLNFTPGMKVGWLVTNGKNSPMTVQAWLEGETGVEQTEYDPEFYAKRIATALGRITEAFGWSKDDLLKGNRQATLFSF